MDLFTITQASRVTAEITYTDRGFATIKVRNDTDSATLAELQWSTDFGLYSIKFSVVELPDLIIWPLIVRLAPKFADAEFIKAHTAAGVYAIMAQFVKGQRGTATNDPYYQKLRRYWSYLHRHGPLN